MESVVFRGNSDDDKVEDFIQCVRRIAFSNNKQLDDVWMAQFAATCFAGPALRWYEGLEYEDQSDWKLLKNKLLENYVLGPEGSSSGSLDDSAR